jgi:hypothetical protein
MAQLAQMLADLTARELDANEQALASCFPPPPELSPDARAALTPFLTWCEQQRVRSLPARPTSVAAFAQAQMDRGVPKEKISATLSAIEALHNAAAVGNPIATPVVGTITAASTIEPPRSWNKEEKLLFTGLPVEIQRVVARREQDRERELRRAQNSLAEERKRLKADAAEAKSATTEKEIDTNAKS